MACLSSHAICMIVWAKRSASIQFKEHYQDAPVFDKWRNCEFYVKFLSRNV